MVNTQRGVNLWHMLSLIEAPFDNQDRVVTASQKVSCLR